MFTLFRHSSDLDLIRGPVGPPEPVRVRVELRVDRFTLARRRWRGRAVDGREFGFDLERPLRHGDCLFQTGSHAYVIAQEPEPVLEIPLGNAPQAARIAWQIGNMHFPVEIGTGSLRVEDDPILRATLEREGIVFSSATAVFQPLAGGGGHRH